MRRSLALLVALLAAGCFDSRPGGADAGASDAGSSDAGSSDAGASDAGADGGPPDAGPFFPPGTTCTPGYACPDGATFRYESGVGRCLWEGITLPDATVELYCLYFDMGTLGYLWQPPDADPSYTCPPPARFAPNEVAAYCVWEDFVPPAGATEDCDELFTAGRLGFRWTCP